MIEDGVHYISCDRPGCNKVVGAQRYENGNVVEEEWVPGMVITEEGGTYCQECNEHRDEFVTPDEWLEGEFEDVSCD